MLLITNLQVEQREDEVFIHAIGCERTMNGGFGECDCEKK
jgi:hypothetical protein